MMQEHSAGIVPFREVDGERKYLLLSSAFAKGAPLEFPKGGLEEGEDEEQAAIREFAEETGIEAVQLIPGFKKVLKYYYQRRNRLISKTVTYFLGKVETDQVRISREAHDYAWLDPSDARTQIRHKSLRILLDEAETFLQRIDATSKRR